MLLKPGIVKLGHCGGQAAPGLREEALCMFRAYFVCTRAVAVHSNNSN
jgi:hypothetical protein